MCTQPLPPRPGPAPKPPAGEATPWAGPVSPEAPMLPWPLPPAGGPARAPASGPAPAPAAADPGLVVAALAAGLPLPPSGRPHTLLAEAWQRFGPLLQALSPPWPALRAQALPVSLQLQAGQLLWLQGRPRHLHRLFKLLGAAPGTVRGRAWLDDTALHTLGEPLRQRLIAHLPWGHQRRPPCCVADWLMARAETDATPAAFSLAEAVLDALRCTGLSALALSPCRALHADQWCQVRLLAARLQGARFVLLELPEPANRPLAPALARTLQWLTSQGLGVACAPGMARVGRARHASRHAGTAVGPTPTGTPARAPLPASPAPQAASSPWPPAAAGALAPGAPTP